MSAAWWSAEEKKGKAKIVHGDAPFYALLSLLFVAVISPQEYLTALAPLRIAFVTAVISVGAFILNRIASRKALVVWSRETVIAALIFAWALVTVPVSIWPGGSISSLLQMYIKTLIVFWLISHVVNTSSRLNRTVILVSLMSIPLAATAVYNLSIGAFIGDGRIAGYTGALTTNPNDLALMLNLMLPLTVALMLNARGMFVRGFFGLVAILSVLAILATYSRGGFVTLAAITFFYVIHMIREGRFATLFILGCFIVFCALVVPIEYLDRVGTIASPDQDPTGSAQERWADMRVALMLILENPIVGVGIGTNELALNLARGEHWLQVHNVYLIYGVELGLPGFFLFVILVVLAFHTARGAEIKARKRTELQDLANISEGVKISIVAFSVAAMFSPVAYQLYFYLYAGLAIAARTIVDSDGS
jgi:putative inorganic carbon (hco3(-)) transporter